MTDVFLDHERLDVYQLARAHAREAHRILNMLAGGRADVADQYRRAAGSIPYNIAEGGGEFAPKEKARFYRIAKRSATECAAILDHMVDADLLPEPETRAAKTLLRRNVGALIKLILSTERISTAARVPDRKRVPVRDP